MKEVSQAKPGKEVAAGESKPALLRLYRWLLRLYPSPFRSEFGDEMQEVFDKVLDETQRASTRTAPGGAVPGVGRPARGGVWRPTRWRPR